MKMARLIQWLLILALLLPSPVRAEEAPSLVPDHDRISDPEARLALAEVLSYRESTRQEAARELSNLIATAPEDPETLARLAGVAANIGHAGTARRLYGKATALPGASPELLIRFADRMIEWGDFSAAERIYRARLKEHPGSRETLLSLARIFVAAQRYEEAEGIYRELLLETPGAPDVIAEFARVKGVEKDFAASLALVEQARALAPGDPRILGLKASILLQARRYAEAREAYRLLSENEEFRSRGLLGIAGTFIEEKAPVTARPYAGKALELDAESVEARFYRDWERIADDGWFRALLKEYESPGRLVQLGELYASHGYGEKGAACYEAALAIDPEYFPARIGLAEILAVMHRYDRSIELYRKLAADFPGNARIGVGLARVLGWAKRYDESIELYGEIERESPADPVPKREKARTAVWGKEMERAAQYYDTLLTPPVDRTVAASLDELGARTDDAAVRMMAETLWRGAEGGPGYRGYEAVTAGLKRGMVAEPALRGEVERILVAELPSYLIRKGAWLEKEAQFLAWNKRFVHALDRYGELVAFQPGNEEAIFSRGQVACALGLCRDERNSYQRLLEIDPLHSLAADALERSRISRRPALELGQSYWEEIGRGELDQLRRYKSTLGVTIPVFACCNLGVAGNAWVEAPRDRPNTYTAFGHTLSLGGVVNRYLSGDAGWTEKRYEDDGLGVKETGHAHLSFNLNDYLRWDVGYDRTDELYNDFGIRQGLQSDAYWTALSGNPTRNFSLSGKGGYVRYSDDNELEYATLSAGYTFSDHPRIFKVTANGEYRNTRKLNVFVFGANNILLDIIHPYWTPRDYAAGSVTFEWHHDLSRFFFCGSELHFYDFKVTGGTDSEENPAGRIEAEWRYEFRERWMVSLKGLLHRSRLWDAIGGWLDIRYRF